MRAKRGDAKPTPGLSRRAGVSYICGVRGGGDAAFFDKDAGNVPDIEIYTQPFCGFCHAAKRLLDKKGVAYTEIDVTMTPGARKQMAERSGGRSTVPQVFVDGRHIGDSDGIHALDAAGKLDRLLGVAAG